MQENQLSTVLFTSAEFMERAEMRFHEEARRNQCFAISACGFDSIPADLGTLFVQQKFQLPSSVEAFLMFKTSGSGFSKYQAAQTYFYDARCINESPPKHDQS